MIKLTNILSELGVGGVLFGEPKGVSWNPLGTDNYAGFENKWKELGLPYEPNTIDEKQLLDLLRGWITQEEKDPKLGEFLKQLLPLKKKFPTILDPIKGRSIYDGTSFYRGTLVPLKDILNLNNWTTNNSVDFPFGSIESRSPYNWSAVSEKGFTSLTPSAEIADGFAADYMSKNGMKFTDIVNRLVDGSGMIPIIVKIQDTHPDVIMNPKVMNLIGGLGEYEVLLIGSKAKVEAVIVPNWQLIEKAADELGVNLTQYFKGL